MYTFEKFCGCCQLEKGTKILAILGIIGALFTIIGQFNAPHSYQQWLHENFGVQMANCAINLIGSIILLIGALEQNASCVLAWLGIAAVMTFVGIIYSIYLVIMYFIVSIAAGFILLILLILMFALNVYVWLCVYSYFKQLQLRLI